MGGLGNGRRGGRTPPLMIGALIACILVLGFNYWVSSSRNLDLQTKLYELEGQVRRVAEERTAAENKKNAFQKECQKQTEQMSHMESLCKRQLEGAQNTCIQEKVILQQNISSTTKTIQELKGQLNQLNDNLGKLQKELQSCQGNKLIYDMTHCNSQILSQKELCDERVAAAKLEVQKKMEKLIPPQRVSSQQEHTEDGTLKENGQVITGAEDTVVNHTPSPSQSKGNELVELLTTVGKGSNGPVDLSSDKDVSKVSLESQPVPSAAAVKRDVLLPPGGAVKANEGKAEPSKLNNMTEEKVVEVMDAHEEGAATEDPGMEGMLIGQGKADETPIGQKLEEPDEYDADEQVAGGLDLGKQQSKWAENIENNMEEELADYNGDDDNEGEFEADKQAALAQN